MSYNAQKSKNSAAFKSALKVLDESPRRIRKARDEYSEACKQMYASRADWSENAQKRFYKEQADKRNAVIQKEVDRMRDALRIVRENRTFPDAVLDIDNPTLQNSLNLINAVGKNLSPKDQLSIIESFKGDPVTLRTLQTVFKHNGYYYADAISELTKEIPESAISDMEYCVNKWDAGLGWDDASDGKIFWSQNEFRDAMQRYGYTDDAGDPWEIALSELRRKYNDDPKAREAAAHALSELEGKTESEKSALFDNAMSEIENMTAERNKAELKWDQARYKAGHAD